MPTTDDSMNGKDAASNGGVGKRAGSGTRKVVKKRHKRNARFLRKNSKKEPSAKSVASSTLYALDTPYLDKRTLERCKAAAHSLHEPEFAPRFRERFRTKSEHDIEHIQTGKGVDSLDGLFLEHGKIWQTTTEYGASQKRANEVQSTS